MYKQKQETFSINLIVDWFTDDYKAMLEKKFQEFLEQLKKYDIQYYELRKDQLTQSIEYNLRPRP